MQINNDELMSMSISELRIYKDYLIGEIKELQKQTRIIDKRIKYLLQTMKEMK